MGNPAHTATQGVNLRIQGPRHQPIGPITPPIPRAMPPSMHAREDEADAGNEHPPRTSRGHTHKVAQASSLFRRRGRRWQRGRHALAADTRTKWPRPRDTFAGEADAGNGADNGTTPGDLAALTPRCAAGPYRWSMGNPAHTATQGVNLRIQGPKHPPKGLTCAVVGFTCAVKGSGHPVGPMRPRVSVQARSALTRRRLR